MKENYQDSKNRTSRNFLMNTQTVEKIRLIKASPALREGFLQKEQTHILRLAAHILHRPVTINDDEWSVALLSVSQAIDSYDEEKGRFWGYAAIVMKNRLADLYRADARHFPEISTGPEVFDGEVDEDSPDFGLQCEIQSRLAHSEENPLRDEIFALQEELESFGISFFDLAACSPKSQKTRWNCAQLIRAMFTPPPPLTGEMRKKKTLPIKELIHRVKISRKLIDRYRKYLITASLILDGEYPGLSDYLSYVKQDISEREPSTVPRTQSVSG
ncbi:MAG: hypothetical protein IJW67_10485 [Blautia sp.]|nr:hypothetical protein [Blautia sp.]